MTEHDNKHDIIFYGDDYEFIDESFEHDIARADTVVILNNTVDTRKRVIEEEYIRLKGITVTEILLCIFRKWNEEDGKYYHYNQVLPQINDTKQCKARITNITNLESTLTKHNNIILKAIEEFVQNGSSYQLYSIRGINVYIDIYKPLGGSSYIDLPAFIKNKQCCINVKNNDDKCFAYALKSCILNKDITHHPERATWYVNDKFDKTLEDVGVKYPFKPDEHVIKKVEKRLNTSINIYTFDMSEDGCDRYPIYITDEIKQEHVNLLYFSNNEDKYHYVWIKNFNGFLNDINKYDHKMFYCMKCMTHFYTEEKLQSHNKDYPKCNDNQPTKIEYPTKDKAFVAFKNHINKFKSPFVIYADFESVLVKADDSKDNEKITHKHIPCGYMMYVVSTIDEYKFRPILYRGQDAVNKFLNDILEVADRITYISKQNKTMIIDEDDELKFQNSTICHICEKLLLGDKVRDHCHLTGKYIGPAHNSCNLNRIESRIKIPVFFTIVKGMTAILFLMKLLILKRLKTLI